jgi:UDP-GlcNAc:undecaprenyl-phosphate GlcNAc-1-phosphate transferase
MVSAFLIAFALAAAATPLLIHLARTRGMYARPSVDRWHLRPVPTVGGIAIAVALLSTVALTGLSGSMTPVMLGCAVMFFMGLVDDVRPLGPLAKFVCQTIAAAVLLWLLPGVHITGHATADLVLGFLWILGISNAVNLLDNMDGLAAGVSAVGAASLLVVLLVAGVPPDSSLPVALAALIGVMGGFLIFNFPPARVFMGDSGSHLLGCFLAGTSLMVTTTITPAAAPAALVPVLALLVPIFDTVFVSVARLAGGRSVFVGGRDHTSHRLAALGLSDRGVVLVFQGLAIAGGVTALGLFVLPARLAWTAALACVGPLALIGWSLGRVTVGGEMGAPASRSVLPEPTGHRLFAVVADVLLLAAAYSLAFLIRFPDARFEQFRPYFVQSLPLVVGVQVAALWLSGKYRRVVGAVDAREAYALFRGSLIGVGASIVAVLYVSRFEGFSRSVFILDAVLAPAFVVGTRVVLGVVDEHLHLRRSRGRAALVYGAGHGGALAVRELQQNLSIGLAPVGYIDDDPERCGTRVDGLPVVAGIDALEAYLDRHPGHIAAVVVAALRLPQERLDALQAIASTRGIAIRRFRFQIEDLPGRDRPGGLIRFPGA